MDAAILNDGLVRYDPDIPSGTAAVIFELPLSVFTAGQFNIKDYVTITSTNAGGTAQADQVRRLTRDSTNTSNTATFGSPIFMVWADGTDPNALVTSVGINNVSASFIIDDDFIAGGALGSIEGDVAWGLENNPNIPEIDIKVDSVAVTAKTKKLKAKWTPELAQDLNAYHNLDAEVELTSILSEHIALEIDQEILEDLVKGATAS